MSDLPFEIPTNKNELRDLFLNTRRLLASTWEGLTDEIMTRRPGPHPEWSVKDIVAHICWWETFALVRLGVLGAGLEIKPVEDYDSLNKQVDAIIQTLPLEAVLAQFDANQAQILNVIEYFSFEDWAVENRPNFPGRSFMFLLGANTFGHYYEHLADLTAFRKKHLEQPSTQ
jgi:hypothetical protein